MKKIILGMKSLIVAPLLLSLAVTPVIAAEKAPAAAKAAKSAIDPAVESAILAKLSKARPDLSFTSVRATDVPELFEVEFNGGNVVYATKSGDFFVVGEIYGVGANGVENLTQKRLSVSRAKALASLDKKDLISFAPKKKSEKEIYVFTDTDCGYCRKLHQEVGRLNELGITVNYLAFPRAGVGSDTYNRMASAWCAKDRLASMTKLKQGASIPLEVCENNPVSAQYSLGSQLGVTGTPAILLADGTLIPGYKPADELAKILGVN